MMDPDPETRPSIEEILLHPNLSSIISAEQKLKVGDNFNQRPVLGSRDDLMASPASSSKNMVSPNYRSIHAMAKDKGTIIISPSTVA